MGEIIIREAAEADIIQLEQLEKICFTDPWSYESLYADVVEHEYALVIVAEEEGKIAGYMGVWRIMDEGHITNVAVAPEYRRKHLATAMMETMIDVTSKEGLTAYTLEVRKSNLGAIALYEGLGFIKFGVRPRYYRDNGEDAIIMWKKL